jgi:hypothetical protein
LQLFIDGARALFTLRLLQLSHSKTGRLEFERFA